MLPPSPARAPIAQSLEWVSRPFELLDECARELGDRFTLDLGAYGLFVVVSSPEDIRDVFRGDPATLHAGEGNGVLRRFLGDGSLLLLEGDEHVRERRILVPAFMPARVRAHAGLIHDSAAEVLGALVPGEVVSVRDTAERLSLRVILRVVLGASERGTPSWEVARELEDRVRAFLDDPKFHLGLLHRLGDDAVEGPAWAAFRGGLDAIRAMLRDAVARRRRAGTPGEGDVISVLVDARDGTGAPLPDERIVDELLTLVVTGYETTATALSWAAVWLAREPRVRVELERRLRAVDARDAIDDPYLDATCREVLRMKAVIPIVARRVCAPFRLGDLELPVGVTVAPCIHLAHHRVATWGDPEVFRPERFLEREPTPWEYLPFGGGARRCLGMPLALLEMKVALAWQARHADLRALDVEHVRAARRSVTIAPAGLRARVGTGT